MASSIFKNPSAAHLQRYAAEMLYSTQYGVWRESAVSARGSHALLSVERITALTKRIEELPLGYGHEWPTQPTNWRGAFNTISAAWITINYSKWCRIGISPSGAGQKPPEQRAVEKLDVKVARCSDPLGMLAIMVFQSPWKLQWSDAEYEQKALWEWAVEHAGPDPLSNGNPGDWGYLWDYLAEHEDPRRWVLNPFADTSPTNQRNWRLTCTVKRRR